MRSLVRRLTHLEERLVPEVDQRTAEAAQMLRERRRRRLEAEGKPFVATPPVPRLPSGRCMSVAETLRHCRAQRLAAQQQGGSQH